MLVEFGMAWSCYGHQQYEVPDGLTAEEAQEYLRQHWDAIPLPDGEYVASSDEPDFEHFKILRNAHQQL